MTAPATGQVLRSPPAGVRGGYSIVELLVACVIIPLLLAASYQTLANAYRFYARQLLLVETREATRVAVEVLGSELRAIGPGAGDLYAMAADSVALRSFIGVGFVCKTTATALSLWRASGVFNPSPTDSLLVFVEGDPTTVDDDRAVSAQIAAVDAGGEPDCPGGHPAQLRLTVTPAPTGVRPGSPVRAFRPHVYRLYRGGDGLWWLGQRLRGGVIQPITGPFAPPALGGLELRFLTAAGVPAGDPREVARIGITLRSRVTGPAGRPVADSLQLLVAVRNR